MSKLTIHGHGGRSLVGAVKAAMSTFTIHGHKGRILVGAALALACALGLLLSRSLPGSASGHPSSMSDSDEYYGTSFVSHVLPESIPAGTLFSVVGRGFGASPGKVRIADTECAVQEWADHAILAQAPDTAVAGLVSVDAGGSTLQGSLPVRVVTRSTTALPSIQSLEITKIPLNEDEGLAEPGDTLTLTGSGFGTQQATAFLATGFAATQPAPDDAALAPDVTSWSPTKVELTVPDGCKGFVSAVLRVDHFVLLSPQKVHCPD
jgi:hypothetical protein